MNEDAAKRDTEIAQLKAEIAQLKVHDCDAEIARLRDRLDFERVLFVEESVLRREHAIRAERAEAERDALRARIADAPKARAYKYGRVSGAVVGLPLELVGKRVALVVVEDGE